jgi:hypothetical protein
LLIACGEASVRQALDEFEGEQLPAFEVERILVPGGCWWLAQAAEATSGRLKRMVASRSSAFEGVASILGSAQLYRVVLTAHQDCSWYRRQFPGLGPGDLVRHMGADMYTARDEAVRLAKRALPVTGTVFTRGGDGSWGAKGLF